MAQDHQDDIQNDRANNLLPYASEYEADFECEQCGQLLEKENAKCPNCSKERSSVLQKLGMYSVAFVIGISALASLRTLLRDGGHISDAIILNIIGIWMPSLLLHSSILGFVVLLIATLFLIIALCVGDDTAGYYFFFAMMTLWIAALVSVVLRWTKSTFFTVDPHK